jgi:DNA-binding transcriptional ArsR family regulator
LKNVGLVTASRQGTRRVYRLDPKGIATMREYLDRMWDKALASFKAFAEAENRQR